MVQTSVLVQLMKAMREHQTYSSLDVLSDEWQKIKVWECWSDGASNHGFPFSLWRLLCTASSYSMFQRWMYISLQLISSILSCTGDFWNKVDQIYPSPNMERCPCHLNLHLEQQLCRWSNFFELYSFLAFLKKIFSLLVFLFLW